MWGVRDEFEAAAAYLPGELRQVLEQLEGPEKAKIQEIRLRANRPLSVFDGVTSRFVGRQGELCTGEGEQLFRVDRELLEKAFVQLCDYSVHTHEQELQRGFITTPKGDRVGVCTSIVRDSEGKTACRDVSSLNLRVSREVKGAGRELAEKTAVTKGVLLAGAPGTGKTTVLRDIGRALASGELGRYYKVVFVDERYELSAMFRGVPTRDIGLCGDAICGLPKAPAMEQAVRTLSPEIIICDELGSLDEVEQLRSGLCCGVTFLASVHCGSREELFGSPIIRSLMRTGAFGSVALLDSPAHPSRLREVITKEEYERGKGDGTDPDF